jgi:hypothetical protein
LFKFAMRIQPQSMRLLKSIWIRPLEVVLFEAFYLSMIAPHPVRHTTKIGHIIIG